MSTIAGSVSEENLRIGSETDSEETDEEEFQEWFRHGVDCSNSISNLQLLFELYFPTRISEIKEEILAKLAELLVHDERGQKACEENAKEDLDATKAQIKKSATDIDEVNNIIFKIL